MKISAKNIWIADATCPLGRALAAALVHAGNFVIASGRDAQVLEQMARESSGALVALPVDFSDEVSFRAVSAQLLALTDRLDIVVANGSAPEVFDIDKFDLALCARQIDTNFLGMVRFLDVAMPLLKRSRSPYIVCSGIAVSGRALAGAEAYAASTAAREYFARSLAVDLEARNIAVSIVRPGAASIAASLPDPTADRFALSMQESARYIIASMEKRKSLIQFSWFRFRLLALANHLRALRIRGLAVNWHRRGEKV